MNRFEKYSSYKDSGVEWLGEIPEHWEIKKLKFICKINQHSLEETTNKNLNITYVDIGSVSFEEGIKNSEKFIFSKAPSRARRIAKKNDTIISTVRTYLKAIDFIDESKSNYIFSTGFAILEPNLETNPKNLSFIVKSNFFTNQVDINSKGMSYPAINSTDLSNLITLIPPKEEQTKIASFLDDKTAQIDEVINQKEKLIELLKERKQIVINDAVTKGLDKDVEFVDSGIEWIGKIPKGWEVKKLKFIIKNKLKYGANESGISYDEALPRYVRITDFSDTGKLSEKNKLSLSWDKGKDYLLKDGDVLFARSGATVGKTYQFKKSMSIEKNYAFAGYLIKAEANETMILSDYLYLYTNSNLFNRWKESIFNKATIENIGADKYSELFFTLPSIEEQKLILKNYFIKSTKIDKAIELQQNYISKLKEYKASLIDSVVTGKVMVK